MTLSNWQNRIVIDKQICHGKPCIRDTRVMVSVIVDYLKAGESVDAILREYPTLCSDDVAAAAVFMSESRR